MIERLERANYILQLAKANGIHSNKCVKDLEDLVSEPEPGLLTWNSLLGEVRMIL